MGIWSLKSPLWLLYLIFAATQVNAFPSCLNETSQSESLNKSVELQLMCIHFLQANGCYKAAESDPELKSKLRDCSNDPHFWGETIEGLKEGAWMFAQSTLQMAMAPVNFLTGFGDHRQKIEACSKSLECRASLQVGISGTIASSLASKDPAKLSKEELSKLIYVQESLQRSHREGAARRGQTELLELTQQGLKIDSEQIKVALAKKDPEAFFYYSANERALKGDNLTLPQALIKMYRYGVCVNSRETGRLISEYILSPTVLYGAGKAISILSKAAPASRVAEVAVPNSEAGVATSKVGSGIASSTAEESLPPPIEVNGPRPKRFEMDGKPVTNNSVIMDTNTAISMKRVAGTFSVGEARRRSVIGRLMRKGSTDLRVTDQVAREVAQKTLESEKKSVQFAKTPKSTLVNSTEHERILKILEDFKVGRAKGATDRLIVSEILESTPKDIRPIFVTGDADVYKNLFRIAHPEIELGKLPKSIGELYPDGFDVTIEGHSLRIVPVYGK